MVLTLSLDITLHVLSYLTLAQAARLHLLCRDTHRFLDDNEQAIYHQFAVSLHFAPQGLSLDDLAARHPVWLKDVRTWKGLCRATVTQGGYLWYGSDNVKQFKINEAEQTIIAVTGTESTPMLTVRALEDGRLLWSLEGVDRIALSDEYLLVWGNGQGIEVWRVVEGAQASGTASPGPLREPSPLAASWLQLARAASAIVPEGNRTNRGVYAPHGFLRPTNTLPFLTYRLKGKLAAVVEVSAMHTVNLWDLEEGVLVRTFDMNAILHPHVGGLPLDTRPESFVLLDMDLTQEHLTVAFDWAIAIVSLREDIDIPTIVFMDRGAPLDVRWLSPRLIESAGHDETEAALCTVLDESSGVFTLPYRADAYKTFDVGQAPADRHAEPEGPWRPNHEWSPCFVSARFSPDGRHLVAGTSFGLFYLLPDFSRVISGDVAVDKIAQKLNLREPISHISWNSHEQRMMIILDSKNILIMTLGRASDDCSNGSSVSLVSARATKLQPLLDVRLGGSHNLQMSRTRLWFSTKPSRMYEQAQAQASPPDAEPTEAAPNTAKEDRFQQSIDSVGMTACFMDFTGTM
ncbi:hypothetical protein PsYK624_048970 [Phanerochaete sordida]|uniref:F-box domain-containing protein n=1 Tax=Phanerochaete sordida TaxID=48140 RepID=A0A9P3LB32_9APHY|nr:hypothetical protein PsYK624_048970 [Phanerochaete sordida]